MSCESSYGIRFSAELIFGFSQDTNTMQYELMRYIAAAHRCVTIVGDPDQSSTISILPFNLIDHLTSLISIRLAFGRNREFGQDAQRYTCIRKGTEFRNAENKISDFPTTEQIFLEQSYRSTGSILSASLAIVAQGLPFSSSEFLLPTRHKC